MKVRRKGKMGVLARIEGQSGKAWIFPYFESDRVFLFFHHLLKC